MQGTINGVGERCGNANLVSIIPILQLKMRAKCFSQKKLKELTQLSHYVAKTAPDISGLNGTSRVLQPICTPASINCSVKVVPP